jgi:hypothetical protein
VSPPASPSPPSPGTSASRSTLRVPVDIGGTFTDLAAFDEHGNLLAFGKALSTHDDLVRGIQDTVEGARIGFDNAFLFLHGSTIVTNTLLERTGAQTALLVTEGFRDIYEIGASTARMPTTFSSTSIARWCRAPCASRSRSTCSPTSASGSIDHCGDE